ncbi:YheC/YheD family protein [Neobacillus sp. OS1-2]|uniref:YheC/YheD family protein n=1 Tax=Neobacillus sp. OS1-2 TaxID=3070680 RepID=UPI0027E140ED|nr:YheC/YheD family protein [Neobacillus sp. OS1-2]WML39232.1 YheC/YheD family protein [Neobacillus sp. OS1-2]
MHQINKWEQAVRLKQNPLTSRNFPETEVFSEDVLQEFLNRSSFVYVKPIGGREGKGVIRISKNSNGIYSINGYTNTGSKMDKECFNMEEVLTFLYSNHIQKSLPNYIIQQGISSFTADGQALGVRVHIQYVKDQWVLGGMLGKLGNQEDGIVNRNRGARALPIRELLLLHLHMNQQEARVVEEKIELLCLEAGRVFHAEHDWLKECGIDIGIDPSGEVWIFEVNMRPSIKFFYHLEDKSVVNQIKKNRLNRK